MANLFDKIAAIRAAVYGADVRETIASGMEAMNTELENTTDRQDTIENQFDDIVASAGSSNSEIVAGRTSGVTGLNFDTFGHRVDKIDDILAKRMLMTLMKMTGMNVNIRQTTGHGMVTFIDDDGDLELINMTPASPTTPPETTPGGYAWEFTSRGVPACAAIIANAGAVITSEANRATLLDLQDTYGWEILSHTYGNIDLDASTPAQVEADCKNFYKVMNNYGFKVDCIAPPQGKNGNKAITSKYYRASFSAAAGYNDYDTDNFNILRQKLGYGMAVGTTLDDIKALVDYAYANDKWLIFMTHCGYENGKLFLPEILEYIKTTKGMQIVTASEGLSVYGDIWHSGIIPTDATYTPHVRLKPNGKLLSNFYNWIMDARNNASIDFNTLPSAYDVGITTKWHDSSNGSGFPGGTTSGTSITMKLAKNTITGYYKWIFQFWIPFNDERMYMRRATSESLWGSFKPLLNGDDKMHIRLSATNAIGIDDSPATIITTAAATSANAIVTCLVTGWSIGGSSKNGLVTFYGSTVSGYQREEFRQASSNNTYVRNHNGTQWSSWSLVTATMV